MSVRWFWVHRSDLICLLRQGRRVLPWVGQGGLGFVRETKVRFEEREVYLAVYRLRDL